MESKADHPQRPLPRYDAPYQPGITDPQWPVAIPDYLTEDVDKERYRSVQSGRVDAQECLVAIYLDVNVTGHDALRELIKELSDYARAEMDMPPGKSELELWNPAPVSRRVTITIGFGHSLFLSRHGDDRFNLRHRKPKWLKPMQRAEEIDAFDPVHDETDLILLVACDDQPVNDRVLMAIKDGRWSQRKERDNRLIFRNALSGYQRLDYQDHLRIADGANNLTNTKGDMDRLVYVKPGDFEPAWCVNGTYLLWKRIELDRPKWESLTPDEQSRIIGRDVTNGREIAGGHIKKVQPQRPQPDLMGMLDRDRRFLRRGYIYVGKGEKIEAGRFFLSYMKSLEAQGEWAVQMWQCNPDFPTPGYGRDPLFESGVAQGKAGGHYFCPPNATGESDFVGSGLFASNLSESP